MNKKLSPAVVVAIVLVALGCVFAVMWMRTESPVSDKSNMPDFGAMSRTQSGPGAAPKDGAKDGKGGGAPAKPPGAASAPSPPAR